MFGIERIYRGRQGYPDAPRWRWTVYYAVVVVEGIVNLLAYSFFIVNWSFPLLFSKFMMYHARYNPNSNQNE